MKEFFVVDNRSQKTHEKTYTWACGFGNVFYGAVKAPTHELAVQLIQDRYFEETTPVWAMRLDYTEEDYK